jgi:hypothetical protein
VKWLKALFRILVLVVLLATSHAGIYIYGQDYGDRVGYERGLYDGSKATVLTYRYMCERGAKLPDGRGGFYWCSPGLPL